MTAHTGIRRYPFDTSAGVDPNPIFAKLQQEEPVSRITLPYGGEGWLVTRYDDARTALADARFSRAAAVGREDIPRITPEPAGRTLLSMDPPEHTRLRKLVAGAFTARRVQDLRPRVEGVVNTLLSEIEQAGPPADLVHALALPLPVTVISEMLGVPTGDQHRFRDFCDTLVSTTAATREQVAAARIGLATYLVEQIALRREHPTDDLLGALVAARDNDDRLSEPELVSLAMIILLAGYETTAGQVANFVYLLLTDPDRWALLCERPQLVPRAVEELLRFTQLSAGSSFPRIATEDVTLNGTLIRAGEAVFIDTQAANLDETVFEAPDTIDLARKHNPHIAFGYGVHHCLGAQLARVELCVALTSLLRRFPTLHLAVAQDEIPWKTGLLVRGPQSLPIAW